MRLSAFIASLTILGVAYAAFPSRTNSLISSLNSCSSKAASDIACISTVKDGLETVSDYIQKVRDTKDNMQKIYNGINGMSNVLTIGGKLPTVGPAIKALKIVVDRMKPTLKSGLDRIKSIDSKIYPWKARADRGVDACDQAIAVLEPVKTRCAQGSSTMVSARDCVSRMPSGSLKTNLGNNMETLGGAAATILNEVNTALGRVGSSCSAVKSFIDKAKRWPNLDAIRNGINSMYNSIRPIVDFFNSLTSILNKKACVPNVIEDIGRGISRGIRRIFGRKRSLVVAKRDICVSVQDILNGVNAVADFILAPLNKLIDELLSKAPSFSLPGLPNLDNIFQFDLNINMPDINFNLDLDVFNRLAFINWPCSVQVMDVCQAGTGAVTVNCGQPSQGGYLGCYQDAGSRDLSSHFEDMGSRATIERCISICKGRGFGFAGAQYYSQCFCHNNYGKYALKSDTECNAPCRGNTGQKCGGTWRNAVYSTN